MIVALLGEDGSRTGEVELADAIFGAKVNVPLMHQVVTAQLAAARAGTHSTKTRGEVRGGGRKPWRQKGTGRARHGSIREPNWRGGGVAFGPKPRDHSVSVPKKMKALALRSALSARVQSERLLVVDAAFDAPKTKRAIAALRAWNVEGKVLLVLDGTQAVLAYAFRNLPDAHVVAENQLNVYDVMNADFVVFTKDALEAFQARAGALPTHRAGVAAAPGSAEPATAASSPGPAQPAAEVSEGNVTHDEDAAPDQGGEA